MEGLRDDLGLLKLCGFEWCCDRRQKCMECFKLRADKVEEQGSQRGRNSFAQNAIAESDK